MSTGRVLLYLALAAVALAPGLAVKLGATPAPGSAAERALAWLAGLLADVRFGSGLRFWLGVAGATMMCVMLLYPLRKIAARFQRLGAVGGWFHLHIVVGLLAPVAVLYHADFGHGSANANVALWSMLAVVASGLAGHFVHARVSARFYGDRRTTRAHLEAIRAGLGELGAPPAAALRIVEELEGLESRHLQPRQGLRAWLASRAALDEQRRRLARELALIVTEAARAKGLAADHAARWRRGLAAHLRACTRAARRGAARSFRDRIWARWRMLHLPLFLVMVAAIVLHVAAVWPRRMAALDPAAPSPVAAVAVGGQTESRAADEPQPTVTHRPVRTTRIEIKSGIEVKSDRTADSAMEIPRPVPATPRARPAAAKAPAAEAPAPPQRIAPPAPAVAASKPPSEVASPPMPASEASALYGELQRRIDPPMALGGSEARSLADQIALYKSRMAAKKFAHAAAETGFALTGKHLRLDCTQCHQKPLKEAPSSNPRACITCHRKDDVHRGRRPDCASCHTTNAWSEITRRP